MSDNKAQFNFYLNRQGVTGKQGPKGEKGFSPVISVEKDTLSEYILRITNESSYFLTTNLRESKEDRGGTYIRYDRDQGVMYAGDADRANKTQYGEVRFATPEEITAGDEGTVLSPADVEDILAAYVTTNTQQFITGQKIFDEAIKTSQGIQLRGTISAMDTINGVNPDIIYYYNASGNIVLGEISQYPTDGTMKNVGIEIRQDNISKDAGLYSCRDNNKYLILDTNNLKAGNNVSFDIDTNGLTINSTGGGQVPEDVALKSADQTFTGHNYFKGQVNFNSTVQFTNQQIEIPKLHSSNKITGVNISLENEGQSFRFPCKKGTICLSGTSGDEAGTTAGLYITGAGMDKKRLLTEGDAYILPQANATTLGGVKANPKSDEDTQAVNIDPATGLLYTKAGGAPTNMVTTDTNQTITGQKIFKNSFVTSDGTATKGNRVLINNASIDLIPNVGAAGRIDYEGISLRGGINSSGLSLQSSPDLVVFGQNNTPMIIYASQLERHSNANDNGAVILDAKNFSSVAPTGNLKYWTGTEADYTGLATKDADTLYRTTDTNKVYLGTIQLGGS